jgi:hypothetical protein
MNPEMGHTQQFGCQFPVNPGQGHSHKVNDTAKDETPGGTGTSCSYGIVKAKSQIHPASDLGEGLNRNNGASRNPWKRALI